MQTIFLTKISSYLISFFFISYFFLLPAIALSDDVLPWSNTSLEAFQRALPRLQKSLNKKKLTLGSPVFIRIFKQENELEIWLLHKNGHYKLLKTYGICSRSGTLGPKLVKGDKQSPEGFYRIYKNQMNPWSKYHLAFNLGYPNEYDFFYNRTGDALMIHGRCSSIGCFAMTDYYMEEIYSLAESALAHGQQFFQVHIFPFRFKKGTLVNYRESRWSTFWQNLKEGYDSFEQSHIPPKVYVSKGQYIFETSQTPTAQTALYPKTKSIR